MCGEPQATQGRDVRDSGEAVDQRALCDRAGQPGLSGCQLDNVHAGERSTPDKYASVVEGIPCARPCHHRSVVVQLTSDRQQLSRLAGGQTPMAVVENYCCKTI